MGRLLFFIFAIVLATSLHAQRVVNDFDTAPSDTLYWKKLVTYPQNGDFINLSLVSDPVIQGTGAMKVDYRTSGYDSWGGFVGIEEWYPEQGGVFDLTGYDSITFRYYVQTPATDAADILLRFCMIECSDAANGTFASTQVECEKYFSFLHILTNKTPGWHYVTIPLVSNDNMEGNGFAQKGWGGVSMGNNKLDLDKIKGFVWEFVINVQSSLICEGSIVFDQMELHGAQSKALTFFNGKSIPSNINFSQGRAGSCVVSDEQSSNPATHSHSLKWTTPGQWDGPIWEFKKPVNHMEQWGLDTLKFKIKAPAGIGDLRIVFQDTDTDSSEKVDYPFEAAYLLAADAMNYDDTWKTVNIPMTMFDKNAGVWDDLTSAHIDGVFDTTKIWQFKIFRTNDQRWQNQVVFLDEIWTGSPVFDVLPPQACAVIQGAAAGNYNNLVMWEDVPNEEDEVYNIYCSTEPITDLNSKKVDHIGYNVPGGTQSIEQPIIAPGSDQNISYYYAVTCSDASGNVGPMTVSSSSTENLAKGVPVIKEFAPANFVVDAALDEWGTIVPFEVSLAANTTHIPDGYGYSLSGDEDFSFKSYLAVDDNYLYVAIDVMDDVHFVDETNNPDMSYLYDGVDIFLGLYDWRGESHITYQKGVETDYHFRFNKWGVSLDQAGGGTILDAASESFKFVEKFPFGYIMEAKIPFEAIAAKLATGYTFKPKVGMRIPIDFIGNDNDGTEPDKTRECVLTYSLKSNDQSYKDVSVWTNTWIGNSWVTGVEESELINSIVKDYNLEQNYPNPFNPSTMISYSVKNEGLVSIIVYDALGREVKTLVNESQALGNYRIQFNGSDLSSGIYFCQMKSGGYTNTIKMMMLK